MNPLNNFISVVTPLLSDQGIRGFINQRQNQIYMVAVAALTILACTIAYCYRKFKAKVITPPPPTSTNVKIPVSNIKHYTMKAELDFPKSDNELLEYITKTLNDTQFQADPHAFMSDWKQKRGGSEELRIPEDQAFNFFEKEVLPHAKIPVSNISYFTAKAQDFAKSDEYKDQIINYITTTLNDPKFQSNPQVFIKNWILGRGMTQEFRCDEDPALNFFKKEVLPHIVDDPSDFLEKEVYAHQKI